MPAMQMRRAEPTGDLELEIPDWEASDEEIGKWVNDASWQSWEDAYRPYWRQVEENLRMLAGRHYDAYIDTIGEMVDLREYLLSPSEDWRDYPTVNWLFHWYKLTLAKLTESPPVIGWVPATADEKDSALAMVMEPIIKYEWDQAEMVEQSFALYGWVIAAGRGIVKLHWDPDRGPVDKFEGPAIIPAIVNGNIDWIPAERVPYARIPGQPQDDGTLSDDEFVPSLELDEENQLVFDERGLPVYGAAYTQRAGDVRCEIVPPVNVITPHGSEPAHEKPWLTETVYLTVAEVQHMFGVEVKPSDLATAQDIGLQLAFGTNYGMPGSGAPAGLGLPGSSSPRALKGMVRTRWRWTKAVPGDALLDQGRLTIVTDRNVKLYDNINPHYVPGRQEQCVIPFEFFDCTRLPMRQEGASDLEILNPLQLAFDRRFGALQDAVERHEQPILLKDRAAGIDEGTNLNVPGAEVEVDRNASAVPLEFVNPPDMPAGSFNFGNYIQQLMQMLGSQPLGSEGMPVTSDASGELQREVRFDTDRVWGGVLRLHSYVWARTADKMRMLLTAHMTDERLMVIAGEDNLWDFVRVHPEMLQGHVHAKPQPESAVLESRQEKQNRIMALVQAQLLPPEVAIQVLNYPDLNRAMRPGGPAWSMAERENVEIALGAYPPVLPEHDHLVHIAVIKRRMQTIEYRNFPPAIQALYRAHLLSHEQLMVMEAARQMDLQAPLALRQAALAGTAESTQAATGPTPDEEGTSARQRKHPSSATNLKEGRTAPGEADPRRVARISR